MHDNIPKDFPFKDNAPTRRGIGHTQDTEFDVWVVRPENILTAEFITHFEGVRDTGIQGYYVLPEKGDVGVLGIPKECSYRDERKAIIQAKEAVSKKRAELLSNIYQLDSMYNELTDRALQTESYGFKRVAVDVDEIFTRLGFEDMQEFERMIGNVQFPRHFNTFNRWQQEDRTKRGLLNVLHGRDYDDDGPQPTEETPQAPTQRSIHQVIDTMVAIIPEDKEELHTRLQSVKSSASYAPPEGIGLWWKKLSEVCGECIGIPKDEWEFRVFQELTTLSREEIERDMQKEFGRETDNSG